jgi:hypothetical protein
MILHSVLESVCDLEFVHGATAGSRFLGGEYIISYPTACRHGSCVKRYQKGGGEHGALGRMPSSLRAVVVITRIPIPDTGEVLSLTLVFVPRN